MESAKQPALEEYARRSEATLKRLALRRLRHAGIWLFGSRARGSARRTSDFDLAYLPEKGFDPASAARLREDIEQSDIIHRVDLVDLSGVSEEFREKVFREGVSWKS